MAANLPQTFAGCGGICDGKGRKTLKDGFWANNPISLQMLDICSALAVTTRVADALVIKK